MIQINADTIKVEVYDINQEGIIQALVLKAPVKNRNAIEEMGSIIIILVMTVTGYKEVSYLEPYEIISN